MTGPGKVTDLLQRPPGQTRHGPRGAGKADGCQLPGLQTHGPVLLFLAHGGLPKLRPLEAKEGRDVKWNPASVTGPLASGLWPALEQLFWEDLKTSNTHAFTSFCHTDHQSRDIQMTHGLNIPVPAEAPPTAATQPRLLKVERCFLTHRAPMRQRLLYLRFCPLSSQREKGIS